MFNIDNINSMRNPSKEEQENQIILRQITDHIFQCLNRIEDNIDYLVFIRKNSNIRNVSELSFYQTLVFNYHHHKLKDIIKH